LNYTRLGHKIFEQCFNVKQIKANMKQIKQGDSSKKVKHQRFGVGIAFANKYL